MNYTLFRVWGIPIRINISLIVFLPILAWLIGSEAQLTAYASLIETMTTASVDSTVLTASERWVVGAIAAVGLFGSVLLHELGHSWMAMRYDIGVESITLWLLGGLAGLTEMPKEWNREFWIAIAGPITSVLVGVSAIAALTVVPDSATLLVFALGFLAVMNIILAVFNMLPAFPMDGGRILRALLARNRSYVSATRTAARLGIGFAILFVFLGTIVAFSPMMIILALFIYVAASSESKSVLLGELLKGLTVDDVISTTEPVPDDATVADVFDRLLQSRRNDLAVVDETGAVVGVVTASRLRDIAPSEYETTTVGEIATTDLPRLQSSMPAFEALYEMMGDPSDVFLVERDGETIGPVSRADFTAILSIRGETVAF
jgi:Zn-dependent protease/CBS domain-containing protein